MSDLYQDPYRRRQTGLYSDIYGTEERQGGLTDAQRQLLPYIDQEKERKKRDLSVTNMLTFVFDILQTGNYASAGMANQIWKSVKEGKEFPETVKRAIKGAWDGLTWEDKKTYSDVIRENLDPETLKKYDEKWKIGSFETPISPVSVAGFVADIFLDPTTYMGFGATRAAKQAAQEAAEDAVKIATRGMDANTLKKLGNQDTINKIVKQAFEVGDKDAIQKLNTVFSNEQLKNLDNVYSKAYREALVTPGEKLREKYLGKIEEVRGTNVIPYKKASGKKAEVDDVLDVLSKKLMQDSSYQSAGERSFRLFGKEIEATRGVRDPWVVTRTWNKLKDYYDNEKYGDGTFGKAWFAIMDSAPMRDIREKLNIRSPYERMIRNKELNYMARQNSIMADKMGEAVRILNPLSDKDKQGVRMIYDAAEVAWNKVKQMKENLPGFKDMEPEPRNIVDIARDLIQKSEKAGKKIVDDPEKVLEFINRYEILQKGNLSRLKRFEVEGFINSAPDELMYYLRSYYDNASKQARAGIGGSAPPLNLHRDFSRPEVMRQEIDKIKGVFGVDDETARRIVNEFGGLGFSTDLDEIIMVRQVIQSKIEAKVELLRQMREFGVPVENLELGKALDNEMLSDAKEKGLEQLNTTVPAMKGLLFDRAIVDVVQRIVNVTDPHASQWMRNIITSFNSWWKGTALLGPHTKIRNFIDNTWTGFMKHGVDWLNIKQNDIPAVIATVYASKKSKPEKVLSQFGIKEGYARQVLNTVLYSDGKKNFTVRDLADQARKYGVFSERTMGYDMDSTVAKMLGKKEKESVAHKILFVGQDLSHAVDEIVENSARVKSFLMDFKEITKNQKNANLDAILEFAANDTKKWFVDYSDLSKFERDKLRNVIPFYTFLRRNLANKLQAIVMYPETFSIFPKLQELASVDDPIFDPTMVPAYMKQLNMFPSLKLSETSFGMFNPGLSVADINKIPLIFEEGSWMPKPSAEELRDTIVSSANPVIKTFVELIPEKGYDTFRKRDLSDTAKAPFLLRYLSNSPQTLQFVDGMMKMMGYDEGLKPTVTPEGKLEIDAKVARIMESNLPLLRHIDTWLMTAGEGLKTLSPAIEKVLEEDFGMKSDYEGLEKAFQMIAYWTGLKFKEVDVEAMKKQLARDIYYSAQSRRMSDMKLAESYQRRRADYRRKEEARIRRLVR